MPAPSSIAIVNAALVRVGHDPVASLTGGDARSIAAKTLYDSVKRNALTGHHWRFALREKALVQLAGHGSDYSLQYDYAYKVPADSVRVFGLLSFFDFIVNGDELYTHDNAAEIIYAADVDEGFFPPYFSTALEFQLASEFAVTLTDGVSLAQMWEERARLAWVQARGRDSQSSVNRSLDVALTRLLAGNPTPRS